MMGPLRHLGILAGLLLLAGCYDAPRTNPFDPALTPAVELLSVTVDNTSGSTTLEWTPYQGQQPFAEYRVLRQVRGLVAVDTVAQITEVRQTSFRDTTPEPAVEYAYWVEVVNQGGFEVESKKKEEVVYALPSIELLEANFSSDTATAELVWNQYRGPGFEAYEVRRKVPGLDEETVKELPEVNDTTYTDSLLDGNTEYTYHIAVRTGWGEDEVVVSNELSGRFYPLREVRLLPSFSDTEPQAIGLAVDEQDRLYVGMTVGSDLEGFSVGIKKMHRGLRMRFPGEVEKTFFTDYLPSYQSPIYLIAVQGKVYVAVELGENTTLLGALDENGVELWGRSVESNGASPVGLYREGDGDIMMLDDQAILYFFSPDGQLKSKKHTFQAGFESELTLPIGQIIVTPGTTSGKGNRFFVLAPEQLNNKVFVRSRLPGQKWLFELHEWEAISEGIGTEKGKILVPVALAFDPQRTRLLVLDVQGRLQVFDVAPTPARRRRYITQWGRWGKGDGEFLVSPWVSAALVVDSQGAVYVADGIGRIQVFEP